MSMAHESEMKAASTEQLGSGFGTDAASIHEVVKSVFDDNFMKLKTVLNAEQVVSVSTALAFAEDYDVPLISKVALNLIQTKVSENGRGLKVLQTVLTTFLGRGEDGDDEMKRFEKAVR